MDTVALTSEQRAALKLTRESNTAFYDHEQTLVDVQTGEILTSHRETIQKTSGEPDYVKLYYRTMLAFNGVDDIPLAFIISMADHMSWSNDGSPLLFFNTRIVREQICAVCGIKEAMYKRYIGRCKDAGLIFSTSYRGTYEVNPFFIAKGKWDSIKSLRAQFDFVNGTWTRHIEESVPDDTTPPQKHSEDVERRSQTPPQTAQTTPTDSDELPGQMSIEDYYAAPAV